MEAKLNAYRVFVGKSGGKRTPETPGRRWEDNIKVDLYKKTVEWTGLS
jgi:hypothetical protein